MIDQKIKLMKTMYVIALLELLVVLLGYQFYGGISIPVLNFLLFTAGCCLGRFTQLYSEFSKIRELETTYNAVQDDIETLVTIHSSTK